MSTDPIVEEFLNQAGEMFGEGKTEYDVPYGVGTHRDAEVKEVMRFDKSDFGYRVGVALNLREDRMPFLAKIDLPLTLQATNGEEIPEYLTKRQEARRKIVNQLLAFVKKDLVLLTNVDDDESYEKLVGLLGTLVGQKIGLRIVEDTKNIKDDSTESGWRKEKTGFTRVAEFLRPKKK